MREYEKQKATGTLKIGDESTDKTLKSNEDYMLDDLWASFRRFLDDYNEKGEKREIKGRDKPNRIRFLECLEQNDFGKRGIVAEFLITRALVECKFPNLPTKD